jgi:hypothetical protein
MTAHEKNEDRKTPRLNKIYFILLLLITYLLLLIMQLLCIIIITDYSSIHSPRRHSTGATQRAAVNELLREHYDDICLTFRYYGGLGSKAEMIESADKLLHASGASGDGDGDGDDNEDTISFSEFMQFVQQSRIWDNDGGSEGLESSRAITMTTLKEVFRVVNSKMETSSGSGARFRVRGDGEFDRAEFMEALVHLARPKFNKMYDNDGSVQLRHLLTDFVSNHAKLLVPNEFRARLAGSDSANLILDHIEVFRFIFDKYADGRSSTMDRGAFLEVLCDVGMMAMVLDRKGKKNILHRRGGDEEARALEEARWRRKRAADGRGGRGLADDLEDDMPDPGLTMEEVHQFLGEMVNDGGSRADGDAGEVSGEGLTQGVPGLVFVGFIEAMARAGNVRWRFEAEDLDHRVETTIQQLRRLQFEKTNRRYLQSGKR